MSKRVLHPILIFLLLSACAEAVTKTPIATGGSKADGIVTMAYDYRFGEQVTADWSAAREEATKRCAAWGYTKTEEFAGVSDRCNQLGTGMFAGSCMSGVVSKNYQCLE